MYIRMCMYAIFYKDNIYNKEESGAVVIVVEEKYRYQIEIYFLVVLISGKM